MDANLLGLLYGTVEDNPSNIQARLMLLDTLIAQEHNDAAISAAQAILKLDPLNKAARDCVRKGEMHGSMSSVPDSSTSRPVANPFIPAKVPSNMAERAKLELDFERQLKEASAVASALVDQYVAICYKVDHLRGNQLREAANICQGRLGNSRLKAARAVARKILAAEEEKAMDIIVEDLEAALEWTKKAEARGRVVGFGEAGHSDPRERLVKRRQVLEAALPTEMENVVAEAFMHVEHEVLGKKYVNDETMLGDAIPEIPRSNFLATEDGYAWDMDELAQALTANGGVMRNPLSKELFSPEDVRRILGHALGAKLRPMHVNQAALKKGVRAATIQKISDLGLTLLQDLTDDATKSRVAVDEFLVFVATLPAEEQKVLDDLKVPGKDTHTGRAFDYTIGESVRDAKSNKTCFHKVGDFLSQASTWLLRP